MGGTVCAVRDCGRADCRADRKSLHPVSAVLIPTQLGIRLMPCAMAIRPARIDRRTSQRNRLRAMVRKRARTCTPLRWV